MESRQPATATGYRSRFSLILGIFLVVIIAAFGVGLGVIILNSGPTELKDAVVAKGYDDATGPSGVGTSFSPEDNPLHCVVTVRRASKGTAVEITWIAVAAGGQLSYTLLDRNLELDGHQDTVDAYLTLETPWPPGSYKVEVRLEGQLVRTLPFTIGEAVRTGTGAYKLPGF